MLAHARVNRMLGLDPSGRWPRCPPRVRRPSPRWSADSGGGWPGRRRGDRADAHAHLVVGPGGGAVLVAMPVVDRTRHVQRQGHPGGRRVRRVHLRTGAGCGPLSFADPAIGDRRLVALGVVLAIGTRPGMWVGLGASLGVCVASSRPVGSLARDRLGASSSTWRSASAARPRRRDRSAIARSSLIRGTGWSGPRSARRRTAGSPGPGSTSHSRWRPRCRPSSWCSGWRVGFCAARCRDCRAGGRAHRRACGWGS